MKTSKVVRMVFEREWTANSGPGAGETMYQFEVEFANGAIGAASFKSRSPWLKEGMEVQYEGPDGKYNRLKLQRPGNGGGYRAPAPALRNEQLDCAIHALDQATRLVVAGLVPKEHIYDSAAKMKNWLMKNGGVGAPQERQS